MLEGLVDRFSTVIGNYERVKYQTKKTAEFNQNVPSRSHGWEERYERVKYQTKKTAEFNQKMYLSRSHGWEERYERVKYQTKKKQSSIKVGTWVIVMVDADRW